MWDWLIDGAQYIWDAIPTSESLFGTDIWNWGGDAASSADAASVGAGPLNGPWDQNIEYTNVPTSYEMADASTIGGVNLPSASTATADTGKSWMDSFKEGVTSPEAIVAGTSILGKAYLDNKAKKDASEKQEDSQEHESTEKQKDRDLQLQMLKEKLAAESGASGAAAAEQRKLARFNAMIRMAEGQRDNALLRGNASSTALQKLAELATNPLRR